MRTVILRDDDTNALTPVECLETLYRPFLARGMPVNLATIPEVRVDARTPDGAREGFLLGPSNPAVETVPLSENRALIDYLQANPGYNIVQHGCYHDTFEFDRTDRAEVTRRLERGALRLREAGFTGGSTFVAPHDKISAVAYEEIAARFGVISTGWFEWRRLPRSWRARYLLKKLLRRPHWEMDSTLLMTHPGCLLSYRRPLDTMLDSIRQAVERQTVTVLVTHWWEYFREGEANEPFVRVLHAVADYLSRQNDLRVMTFAEYAAMAGERPPALQPDVQPAA
jgi:hypothetical protein